MVWEVTVAVFLAVPLGIHMRGYRPVLGEAHHRAVEVKINT